MAMTRSTSMLIRHQLIECRHGMFPGSSQKKTHTPTTSSIKNTAVRHEAQPAALNQRENRALNPPPAFFSAFFAFVSFFLSAALSAGLASAMMVMRSLQCW
jgi:hypothetical protein